MVATRGGVFGRVAAARLLLGAASREGGAATGVAAVDLLQLADLQQADRVGCEL